MRTLLSLIVFCASLWLTIEVFGAIVTGEMNVVFTKVKRDAGKVRFWGVIFLLGLVGLAGLTLAAGLLFNVV